MTLTSAIRTLSAVSRNTSDRRFLEWIIERRGNCVSIPCYTCPFSSDSPCSALWWSPDERVWAAQLLLRRYTL